jgi:hypothetical protein
VPYGSLQDDHLEPKYIKTNTMSPGNSPTDI